MPTHAVAVNKSKRYLKHTDKVEPDMRENLDLSANAEAFEKEFGGPIFTLRGTVKGRWRVDGIQ